MTSASGILKLGKDGRHNQRSFTRSRIEPTLRVGRACSNLATPAFNPPAEGVNERFCVDDELEIDGSHRVFSKLNPDDCYGMQLHRLVTYTSMIRLYCRTIRAITKTRIYMHQRLMPSCSSLMGCYVARAPSYRTSDKSYRRMPFLDDLSFSGRSVIGFLAPQIVHVFTYGQADTALLRRSNIVHNEVTEGRSFGSPQP
jgi:hypothetical protein